MAAKLCGRGSVVEHHLAKVRVASSNLVARSIQPRTVGPGLCLVESNASDRAASRSRLGGVVSLNRVDLSKPPVS